jgi:hypothetical protein
VIARRTRWIAAAVIVPIVAVVSYFAYAVATLFNCEVDIRKRILSPDGAKSIVISGVDCGATTPFNTQVSIASNRGKFSREKAHPFLVVRGQHEVAAKWLGDDVVGILGFGADRVYKQEQSAGEIRIEYK